mgnify:CR=1 FL=1
MKAVLLAAGLGTRLGSITQDIPKCLVPIAGRPLLSYWLDSLSASDCSDIFINLHYHSDQVRTFINNREQAGNITLSYEHTLLGTGGTLIKNWKYFNGEPILVIHADNLCLANLTEFSEAHKWRPSNTEITMMTFTTTSPQDSGIVEVSNRGIVTGFYEKVADPPSCLANGAVYIFEPGVLDFMKSLDKSQLDISTEVLPHYIERIFTWQTPALHIDVGTPTRLSYANEKMNLMSN